MTYTTITCVKINWGTIYTLLLFFMMPSIRYFDDHISDRNTVMRKNTFLANRDGSQVDDVSKRHPTTVLTRCPSSTQVTSVATVAVQTIRAVGTLTATSGRHDASRSSNVCVELKTVKVKFVLFNDATGTH